MKKIVSTLLLIFPVATLAAVNCRVDRALPTKNIILQGPEITLSPNINVGDVFYTGFITNIKDVTGDTTTSCYYTPNDRSFSIYHYSALSGAASSLGNGIFATNLPGVGVRFYNDFQNPVAGGDWTTPLSPSSKVLSIIRTFPMPTGQLCDRKPGYDLQICRLTGQRQYRFQLIKTADISPGYINGSSFPTINVTLSSPDVAVPSGVASATRFSGGIRIVAPTCNTSDYTVDLGRHDVKNVQQNQGSPWVDASITLTGCPQFNGRPDPDESALYYNEYNTPVLTNHYIYNVLRVSLSPMTSLRAGKDGIFLIEQSGSSATGVDIQLHKGNQSSNAPVVFNSPADVTMAPNSGSTMKIPLVARYVVNGDSLSAGKANGKVIFTIDYF